MPSSAIAFEEYPMIIDYVLGAIVTAGLLVYLVYALIRPERF
jgi:K+-transporting ATPase KdpF subunit